MVSSDSTSIPLYTSPVLSSTVTMWPSPSFSSFTGTLNTVFVGA